MEIEKVVQEEMTRIVESGKLRTMVATSLEKSIQEVVNDALRSYSDFGKVLTMKVKEVVGVELHNVNFQSAVLGLGQLVEAQVSKYITEQSHPELMKRLDELFEPAPKTITLQDVIDAYKEDNKGDAADDGITHCGLVICEGTTTGFIQIGLNPKSTKRMNGYGAEISNRDVSDCEIKMHLKSVDGGYQIYWIGFDGHSPKSSKDFLPMALYGFSRQVFQMYASGTVLILNEDMDAGNYDLHYPGND